VKPDFNLAYPKYAEKVEAKHVDHDLQTAGSGFDPVKLLQILTTKSSIDLAEQVECHLQYRTPLI